MRATSFETAFMSRKEAIGAEFIAQVIDIATAKDMMALSHGWWVDIATDLPVWV